jgi:hypothetical protein
VHSYTEFLGLLDADPKVFISGNQDSVADRAVPGERDHVCHYQRVHALLLTHAVHKAKPYLNVLQMRQSKMLCRGTSRGAVIPINPEKRYAGNPLGKCAKCLNGTFVCDLDFSSRQFFPRKKCRALSEKITCVNENRYPIHRPQK